MTDGTAHGSTRTRVLHWFVRGGEAKGPDGKAVPIDVDPIPPSASAKRTRLSNTISGFAAR